jgi:hypothetical protein
MYELRINPVAKQDLFEIKEYITKELDNPTAAVYVSIYRILYSRRDYVKVLFNEELHSNKEQ